MAKKEEHHIDPDKIHLLKIEPVEVSIAELDNLVKDEEIDVKMAHLSAYNLEDKKFLLGLDIILKLPEREPIPMSRFRYNFHFKIDNLEMLYSMNEENKPVFKKIFGGTLAGISYSTLRGIIYEKTTQSSWGSLTLPVINPIKIMDTWIELE